MMQDPEPEPVPVTNAIFPSTLPIKPKARVYSSALEDNVRRKSLQ